MADGEVSTGYVPQTPLDGMHSVEDLAEFSRVAAAEIVEEAAALGLSSEDTKRAHDILAEAAVTFRERNAVYGDNYLMVGAIMTAMFPNGVTLRTADDFNRWHLFELKIVKLSRFAISGLRHVDSIRDDCVYSAMVESLIHENSANLGGK